MRRFYELKKNLHEVLTWYQKSIGESNDGILSTVQLGHEEITEEETDLLVVHSSRQGRNKLK